MNTMPLQWWLTLALGVVALGLALTVGVMTYRNRHSTRGHKALVVMAVLSAIAGVAGLIISKQARSAERVQWYAVLIGIEKGPMLNHQAHAIMVPVAEWDGCHDQGKTFTEDEARKPGEIMRRYICVHVP
jgi:hypothetical protein